MIVCIHMEGQGTVFGLFSVALDLVAFVYEPSTSMHALIWTLTTPTPYYVTYHTQSLALKFAL